MKKDFNELLDIIRRLRAPGGCPWDREQTHLSLKKHLIEEAYEAADAIDEGNSDKIADELGDVLLQIVMHAQIGSEEGTFDINDVTDAICKKMIVRHPHVFSDVTAETSDEVLKNWDEIKKRERGQKTTAEAMESVTRSLPSLTRSTKIIGKADKSGMIDLLSEANASSEDCPGKKLFEICLDCYSKRLDPEEELYSYIKKIIKKFKNIEENT